MYQKQIAALMATRAAKTARIKELLQKATDEGRTLDSDETEEFDTIDGEVKRIDADLQRLKRAEAIMVETTATPVRSVESADDDEEEGGDDEEEDEEIEDQPKKKKARVSSTTALERAPIFLKGGRKKTEDFKGQNFTRLIIAKAAAHIRNHEMTPAQYAEHRWGKAAAGVVAILKSGVPGAGTMSGDWGAELVAIDSQYRGDFIEFLYSKTVYDKLPLREVPANVTIKGQDGAGSAYWVGEKKAIPATALDFSDVTLKPLKVGALATISNELILTSDPSAEALVRDGLANASAQRIDTTFLSAAAAVANVSPAGILNGVSGLTAGGEDGQSLRDDIGRLYAPFIGAKNASGLVWVMYTGLAKSISLMRNPLDAVQFPGITVNGGTFEGDPVYTGENVGTDDMILLKPSDIYKIGDSGLEVSISKEATIEQDTAPTGDGDTPATASVNMVNMFQNEMTAFKVVRRINFAKRRSSVVQYVTDATYGGSAT